VMEKILEAVERTGAQAVHPGIQSEFFRNGEESGRLSKTFYIFTTF